MDAQQTRPEEAASPTATIQAQQPEPSAVTPEIPAPEPSVEDIMAVAPLAPDESVQTSEASAAPALSQDPKADGQTDGGAPADRPAMTEGADKPATEPGEANKVRVCIKALKTIERDINNIIRLLENESGISADSITAGRPGAAAEDKEVEAALGAMEGRVVEGVFDGQAMVGSDGKSYTVPANYASKSKLVEGDLLKLTITPKGTFIYKQIGPIERSRLIGSLGFDQTIGEYYATSDNRRWSVLKASVTYFKGEPGDEVVLLVPKSTPSRWAAVENIIRKNPLT